MGASRYVHLEDAKLVRVTASAALIAYRDEQYWIPLGQMAEGEADKLRAMIDKNGRAVSHDPFTLSITEWIAEQKEIDADG